MKIGYARVSKNKQDEALQLDALVAAGVDKRNIYVDKASGKKQDRKSLKDVLDVLEPGDDLVIWKLDRLGRSASKLIALVHELAERDIGFVVTTGLAIDTRTTEGKFILHLFAGLAEMELDLISERIKAGQAAARNRGRKPGRPKAIDIGTVDAAITWQDNGDVSTVSELAKMFKVTRPSLSRAMTRRRAELQQRQSE